MPVNTKAYQDLSDKLSAQHVALVAVSKTKPVSDIEELYRLGHRDFGENYVQEFLKKQEQLPADIRWHFIGHLQSNKAKLVIPVVYLVHGIDSARLLSEIDKQSGKAGSTTSILLQVHIAQEETKFGLDEQELRDIITNYKSGKFPNVRIRGLMGMASFTENKEQVKSEFSVLKKLFDSIAKELENFDILSMGMSGDYDLAINEGSNMVRIGSLLFGNR